MKFMGSMIQGIGAYDAGKYTRNVMNVNATNSERDGAAQGEQVRDAAAQTIGRQQAAFASSGFDPGSGSAIDALRESLVNRDLEVANIRRTATSKAQAYRSQGALAYSGGFNQLSGSFFSGVAATMDDMAKASAGGG